MASNGTLSVKDIHDIHDRIVAAFDLAHPDVRRRDADRFIRRIVRAAGEASDPFEEAAVYLERLIDAHVFEDGNKRTAWLTAVRALHEHDKTAAPDRNEVATVLKHVRRFETAELARWLETGDIDRTRLRE